MIRTRLTKWLTTDFSSVLSGNVLYSACQLGIVLILAKLGSPEQVGEYALGLAVSAPIILVANLQLRVLLASDLRDQFTFGEYLAFRLISLGAAMFVVGGVVISMRLDWSARLTILLVGFAQSLEFVSEIYYGLMQKHDRLDRLSRSLMIKGALSLAALWIAMYVTRSVPWAVVGLALGRLFVLLAWDSRLGFASATLDSRAVRLSSRPDQMGRLLRMALPLGIISMLNSLNVNIPRYFIEAHRGAADLGLFAALASLMSVGSLVMSAFGQSIFVPVARACAAADRAKYRSFVSQAVTLGVALGGSAILAAALFGREILSVLFRPEYGGHNGVFVRLMFAGMVTCIASGLGHVMTAARVLNTQIPLLMASVLTAVAASAWLVPKFGLEGAADAVLSGALIQLGGSTWMLLNIDRRFRGTPALESHISAGPEPDAVESSAI